MKHTLKRTVSWVLCLMMVMSLAPGGVAFAEESTEIEGHTYYTSEMIKNARANASSAYKSEAETAINNADYWLKHVDTIYNMVTNQTIPRSVYLCEQKGTLQNKCMYCGVDQKKEYDGDGWNIDMIAHPWKIQCRNCENFFPTNDFASFYKLGINENGEFDRNLALKKNGALCGRGTYNEVTGVYTFKSQYANNPYGYGDPKGYLCNEIYVDSEGNEHNKEVAALRDKPVDPYHNENIKAFCAYDENTAFSVGGNSGVPSAGYFWGVDDGLGYNTGRKDGTVDEIHRYVAVANYGGIWYWHGSYDQPVVYAALTNFRDAYLYTGEKKYAIAGAKILDRVADLYPAFDYRALHQINLVTSGNGKGKISGYIHENFVNRALTTSYDAFYNIYDDAEQELVEYLSKKAKTWGLKNQKTTTEDLRRNVEENILKETYKAVVDGNIKGNFGMMHETLVTAAVILDNDDPTAGINTAEMIDYAMTNKEETAESSQIALYDGIFKSIDRDGYVDESSLTYNNIFAGAAVNIIKILSRYEAAKSGSVNAKYAELASNPKVIRSLAQGADLILSGHNGNNYMPNIGDDSSNFGNIGIMKYADAAPRWLFGLEHSDDPVFAQLLHLTNGNKADGIKYDIFTAEPEEAAEEVAKDIQLYGELDLTKSNILTGYGFGALREGTSQNAQNWWMYWGPYNTTHGHADALNLGLGAFGINFAPDLGYGASGSTADKNDWNTQWIEGTTSHNTVVVNDKQQTNIRQGAFPLHFDDAGEIKVMDVDVPDAYGDLVKTYRRTVVSVNIDDTVSYALDFFHVVGGNEHVYSFHASSGEAEFNEGVELVPQTDSQGKYVGTYAGAKVGYGTAYPTKESDGFSWLINVDRAANPGSEFAVDFEITNYQKEDNRDLHLKLTQLNGFKLDEVARADGETIPGGKNPKYIDYILARRSGENGKNLDTLFTTVLEPYENSSKIKSLTRVDVTVNGMPLGEDAPVAAVKVELVDGRTDYVVYSADNNVTYTVGDLFDFRGFVGVYTVDSNKEVIRTYINDGTQIGDEVLDHAAIAGEVKDFTDPDELKVDDANYITVSADNINGITDTFLKSLVGRMIVIENGKDAVDNAAYVIKSAEKKDENIRIGTGGVDFARRNAADENDDALSFVSNFKVGDSYRIALSAVDGSFYRDEGVDQPSTGERTTFTFNNSNIVDDPDYLVKDEDGFVAGSATNVIGYGTGANAHNWCFYGFGANAQKALDNGGGVGKMVNLDDKQIRIRTTNTDAGAFDTTAGGGTAMALSLRAPTAGYYKPVVYNGTDALVNSDILTVAFGPEKNNNSVDDYIDKYKLASGGAIYSDGETPIILAIKITEDTQIVTSSVLTPIGGKLTLSSKSLKIRKIGETATISMKIGDAPIASGFAEFTSGDEDVATVSPEGVVTGVADGTTTVKVEVGDDVVGEVDVTVGTGEKAASNFGTKSAYIREMLDQDKGCLLTLLSGIDVLQYAKVGFEVSVDGGETKDYETTTVYKTVKANGEEGKAKVVTPDYFGGDSKYIFVYKLPVFSEDVANATLTYRPYAIDFNENRIRGKERTIDKIYDVITTSLDVEKEYDSNGTLVSVE